MLFVDVRRCSLWFAVVWFCLLLFVVCGCSSLFVAVCYCLCLLVVVRRSLRLFAGARSCWLWLVRAGCFLFLCVVVRCRS